MPVPSVARAGRAAGMKILVALPISALFNGKDLSGWKLQRKADPTWKVVSSVKIDPSNQKLIGEGSGGRRFILLRILLKRPRI
jgi:hypothetical protein